MTAPKSHGGNELLEAATDFELVVKSSEMYCDSSKRHSQILSLFYGMWSAFKVSMSLGRPEGNLPETATDDEAGEGDYVELVCLPTLHTVRSAREKLVTAVASNSWSETMNALSEMRIFALCPVSGDQMSRMERLASNVSGRARLVFAVELALFALEIRDFTAVRRHVTEAWDLNPSAWELYSLCVLEGLFALEAGKAREAIQWLEKSMDACQTDEHTSIRCGIRPPNFLLVQRLFEQGERVAVLSHLIQCRNVWQLPRMPMEGWINLIECGKKPDFQPSGFVKGLNQPSCRLSL